MNPPMMDRETFVAWMAANDVPWEPYAYQIPTNLTDEEREAWSNGWVAACWALLKAGRAKQQEAA